MMYEMSGTIMINAGSITRKSVRMAGKTKEERTSETNKLIIFDEIEKATDDRVKWNDVWRNQSCTREVLNRLSRLLQGSEQRERMIY
jgi:hypothetical protein